jgi:hypothetical protein
MVIAENIKQHIIEEINDISDDSLLIDLERLIQQWKAENAMLLKMTKPRRKTLNIEELKKEQGFVQFDKAAFKTLVAELAIQEPIEELVAMI